MWYIRNSANSVTPKTLSAMRTAAQVARIAMWIMIAALLASFFTKGRWITITWITAAVVCGVCIVIVSLSKAPRRRGR